jgi:membrane protein DedA with SNARE-associated domain
MHWARFLAFNALGAALWVAVWTSVGYLSGNHINQIYNDAIRYDTYLAIAVGALVLAFVIRRIYLSRRRQSSTPTGD